MDFKDITKARKVLDPVWKASQLRGRCWGLKRKNNPYAATNITMAMESELVSVSQAEDGTLRIHEFSKAENTSLGNKVRQLLQKEGLSFEK